MTLSAPTPAPALAPEFPLLIIDGDADFANIIAGVGVVRMPASNSSAHNAPDAL